MDCDLYRRLMNVMLDGDYLPEEASSFESHLAGCPSCRREWALFSAVDRILMESSLETAPDAFERSVLAAITQRVGARRRIESVVIPAACGAAAIGVAYGIHRVVNWETARSIVRGIGTSVSGAAAPLADPMAGAPDVVTAWLQNPAIQGAVLALAVAATIFLGVSAIRFYRQFTLEYQ